MPYRGYLHWDRCKGRGRQNNEEFNVKWEEDQNIQGLISTTKDLASYQKLMVIYFKSFNQVDESDRYIFNNHTKYLILSFWKTVLE